MQKEPYLLLTIGLLLIPGCNGRENEVPTSSYDSQELTVSPPTNVIVEKSSLQLELEFAVWTNLLTLDDTPQIDSNRIYDTHHSFTDKLINMVDPEMFEKYGSSSPEKVARALVKGVKNNKRQILVGADAQLLSRVIRLIPETLNNSFCRFAQKTMA